MTSVVGNSTVRYCDQLATEIDIHVLTRLRAADASPLSVQTACLLPMLYPDFEAVKLRVFAT